MSEHGAFFNEYGSLLMGAFVLAIAFSSSLLHIRHEKGKRAKGAEPYAQPRTGRRFRNEK